MPVYESPPIYTYEMMTKDSKVMRCDCGGELTVAWSADHNCHVLRCGIDLSHNKFCRPPRVNDHLINPNWKYSKEVKRTMRKELGPEKAALVLRHQGETHLSIESAIELVKTYWPKAPALDITKASMICHRYQLDPARKHLHLVPYTRKNKNGVEILGPDGKKIVDWTIIFGIGAKRLNARRQCPRFKYINHTPRPMNEAEQKELLGGVDATKLWFITWLDDGQGNEFFGLGNCAKGTSIKGADKGNTAQNMAAIRSESQAFDRMCPDWELSGDVVDERYAETPSPESKTQIVDVQGTKVSQATGEILDEETPEEGIFEEVDTVAEVAEVADVAESPAETVPAADRGSPQEVPEIKTLSDLYKAARLTWPNRYRLIRDVLADLGKTETEIVSPLDEYTKLIGLNSKLK